MKVYEISADAARRTRLDAEHPCVLEYHRAVPVDCRRQPSDISDRVQFKLVREADRAMGRKGEVEIVHELDRDVGVERG